MLPWIIFAASSCVLSFMIGRVSGIRTCRKFLNRQLEGNGSRIRV